MTRFIIKRLLYGIGVMIAIIVIVTSIIYNSNVDPAEMTFGQRSDTGSIEAKRKELGLDKPLHIQQMHYLKDISPISFSSPRLNKKYHPLVAIPLGKETSIVIKKPYLRESYQTGYSVSSILWTKVPRTAILAFLSILLATLIGIVLGVTAALFQNTWIDNIAVVVSVLGYSLPSYVTAMILALIFAYYLGDYTGLNITGGLTTLNDSGDEVFVWRNLILPVLALGIRPIGIFTQLTRSAMLDVLSQDYIRTAKSKGLSTFKVNFKHGLRNALNPVSTAITGWFASLVAGAFFVENVFAYDGLGLETIRALETYDIPVILGVVLFMGATFVIINILSDILYAFLDPRVRLGN
jgi:peptide/nickel transport system permease protein